MTTTGTAMHQPKVDQSRHHDSARRKHEEDKRRKEKEYQKAKIAKEKAEKERAAKEKDKANAAPENRLKRQTAFLCQIQFRNDLPPVPVAPALLPVATGWDRFVSLDSALALQAEQKHHLLLNPLQAIPLDVLEAPQYQILQHRATLHPDDQALLESTRSSQGPRVVKTHRAAGADFTWLMKTQYISEEAMPKMAGVNEQRAKQIKQKQLQDREDRDPLQIQLDDIESSFASVRAGTPKHPTKPHLHAVEVRPVFPDFDRWPLAHVQVLFDVQPAQNMNLPPPTPGAEPVEPTPEQVEALGSRAVIKSFTVPVEGGQPEKFAAFMVPTWQGLQSVEAGALDQDEEATTSSWEGGEAVEYHWVREYHYEAKPEETVQDNYIFCFKEDQVTYASLNTKLMMQKKKARGLQDRGVEAMQDISRPQAISVRKRRHTEEEIHLQSQVRRKLEQPEENLEETNN